MSALFWLSASVSALHAGESTPVVPIVFDVVSVKQVGDFRGEAALEFTPDGMRVVETLHWLVCAAFDMRPSQVIGGPKWEDVKLYEIRARVAESDISIYQRLDKQQRMAMLQTVLLARFGLKLRREFPVRPVYRLVLDKTGTKMRPCDTDVSFRQDGSPVSFLRMDSSTHIRGTCVETPKLARFLSNLTFETTRRVVVDKTNLQGRFDFELRWAAEPSLSAAQDGKSLDIEENPQTQDPTLFTALSSQLGLRLQPGEEPVEVLVIEQAHPATEN